MMNNRRYVLAWVCHLLAIAHNLELCSPAQPALVDIKDLRLDAIGPPTVFQFPPLQPFKVVHVGRDDCSSAFDVVVVGCDPSVDASQPCKYLLEVHAQADVVPLVKYIVDSDALKISVVPPGFKTSAQLMLVVTVPHGALEEVEIAGDARMIVETPVPLVRNAGSGFLRVHVADSPAAVDAFKPLHRRGGMRVELTGSGPVLFCASTANPLSLQMLELHLWGSASMAIHNVVASEVKIFLGGETAVGIGDVFMTGPPSEHAIVYHMGNGNAVVSAHTAEVRLAGSGSVFVQTSSRWTSRVTGQISETGLGNVYYTLGSCTVRGNSFNKCVKSSDPPPPQQATCADFGMVQMRDAFRSVEVNVSRFYECRRSGRDGVDHFSSVTSSHQRGHVLDNQHIAKPFEVEREGANSAVLQRQTADVLRHKSRQRGL